MTNCTKEPENDVVKTHNDAIDSIRRSEAIEAVGDWMVKEFGYLDLNKGEHLIDAIEALPSAQQKEVIPHRNYKYLSDYWCECGWHLGKKGEVKYCSGCGRKVNWDE